MGSGGGSGSVCGTGGADGDKYLVKGDPEVEGWGGGHGEVGCGDEVEQRERGDDHATLRAKEIEVIDSYRAYA